MESCADASRFPSPSFLYLISPHTGPHHVHTRALLACNLLGLLVTLLCFPPQTSQHAAVGHVPLQRGLEEFRNGRHQSVRFCCISAADKLHEYEWAVTANAVKLSATNVDFKTTTDTELSRLVNTTLAPNKGGRRVSKHLVLSNIY